MKTRLQRWPGNSAWRFSAPVLALSLSLVALPSGADTNFTATGWLSAVPIPGITCTNGSGQVALKGNVHVVRNLADDALVTGRLHAWMDLAYQTDGTALFSGPAYLEVGTWDAAGTNFTPSGGVWSLNYRGVAQADGSSQYDMAGYGIGGSIEALRISVTATRSAPGDPTTPYLASGTIKPAPVNTSVVLDEFSNGQIWTLGGAGSGTLTRIETNGVFTLGGNWLGHPTWNLYDTTAWAGMYTNWSVPDGQTIEARVDLMNMNEAAIGACLTFYHADGQGYGFAKAGEWICLWKHNWVLVCFCAERVTTSNTNVVLTLSITPAGQNVVLTGQVLDKQTGAVLCQQRYVDTPAADPSLSQAELADLTGCRVWHDWGADPAGAPWKNGNSACLFVFQDTDGTEPPATATFDNLELFMYEIPRVGIERAVRLAWPSTGMNFGVEGAPTLQGPWLPLNNTLFPGMQQITVPVNKSAEFFRLQQSP